jgi:hypothetical protein
MNIVNIVNIVNIIILLDMEFSRNSSLFLLICLATILN